MPNRYHSFRLVGAAVLAAVVVAVGAVTGCSADPTPLADPAGVVQAGDTAAVDAAPAGEDIRSSSASTDVPADGGPATTDLPGAPADPDALTVQTEDIESACDAVFLFAMAKVSLVGKAASAKPLTEHDVAEVFGMLLPYVPQFSDELARDFETYHGAAVEAIGQDSVQAMDILGRDEVEAAGLALTRDLMISCRRW